MAETVFDGTTPMINLAASDRYLKRLMHEAAEMTMLNMLIMMELGGLNLPREEREMIAESFVTWSECHFELQRREEARKKLGG